MARARYHLQILADTAADLSGVRHPHKILESFLLSAQGGVGARGGFAAILGDRPEDVHLITSPRSVQAGFSNADELSRSVRELAGDRKIPFFTPCLLGSPCAEHCAVTLICPLGEHGHGLLGLDASLRDIDYDEEDHQLLTGLALLFQTSLRFALFSARVEMLNAELEKRNETLDRQVFHLNALRELSREIRPDMLDVAENLLLTVLGHFSRPQGLILIHDRIHDVITRCIKGVEAPRQLAPDEIERLFFLCLSGVRNKHLHALQVEAVDVLPDTPDLPLGFTPQRGYLFMLREHLYGVVLLGPGLEPEKPGEDAMLASFLTQGVLLLNNADSFATIQTLNDDLVRQNAALRQTIDELTSARNRISMLEAAGKRIAGIVHQRSAELARIRWIDFVLIIGLSLGLGFVYNHHNPSGIPLIEPPAPPIATVSVTEAQTLVATGNALLIDARPREFYERGHVEGAVNVPAQLFDLVYMMQLASEDPDRPIVIYGRSISRHYDTIVARKFLGRDHERVVTVDGDMPFIRTTGTP